MKPQKVRSLRPLQLPAALALAAIAGGCLSTTTTSKTDGGAADGPAGGGAAVDVAVERAAPAGRCGTADRSALAAPSPPLCPGEDDAGSGEFGPARPLGVGYPDRSDLIPPHTAYLTFDDGPSDWTGQFLDVLAAKGVPATFFINAKNFKGAAGLDASYIDASGAPAVFRDVVRRAVDEGHALGNHTVDHSDLAALSDAAAQAELDDNERLVATALIRAGGRRACSRSCGRHTVLPGTSTRRSRPIPLPRLLRPATSSARAA